MKIGIDLGGSHIAIGVVDNDGRILEKKERRILKEEKKAITEFIEDYIFENIKNLSNIYKITSIGIAIPGTLNKNSIVRSVNLGIENYNIVERLKERIDLPIKIKNDAKCAALAENSYGSLKNYSRSIFLTLGTGIGGAAIIDNELLNTGELPGMEVGHMVIQKNGIPCNCGNIGCFERYASMKVLKNNLRNALGLDETTRGEQLLDMIRNNSIVNKDYEKIENVVNEFIENLSIGISNLVNLFEPEAVVIGGSFVFFEDVLLERLKKSLKNGKYLFNKREEIVLKPAVLGNDAGIIGASLI
ncbi:MAG: ROK family protein [Clostridia bacterium]|nr:ROK family protein [Clostridia bacterium]